MPQFAYLIIGIVAAYLLGAIPSGYLAARWTAGIDLRKHGTGGIGLSNVWHTVPARWIIVPVILADIVKVMPAVWWAAVVGLDLSCQVIIGMAALIGHNWPVYLRFHGGRGMLCTVGFVFILPVANGMVPWPLIAGLVVVFSGVAIIRSSAISVGLSILTPVVVSLIMGDPLPLSLGYLAAFLLMIFRRLVQPRTELSAALPLRRVLWYRLILDRDIRDRKKWVKR